METSTTPFIFPKWTNLARKGLVLFVLTFPLYIGLVVTFGMTPYATDVGYMPKQPVPYSHALHAGELGMDCRYCHTTVEKAAHAAIPPTTTCMNCHSVIWPESNKLEPVRTGYVEGKPVEWVRVHDLPDYVYFNHAAHVNRGVGCVSCHGRVDKMVEVWQHEPLSMSWCLDCHRQPEKHLRPVEEVTNMSWQPPNGEDQLTYGRKLREQNNINPSTDCSTCHR